MCTAGKDLPAVPKYSATRGTERVECSRTKGVVKVTSKKLWRKKNIHKGVEVHMKARGTVLSRRIAHAATVSDWGSLHVGERVEIIKQAHVIAAGEVEEISRSGNVLWLVCGGAAESQLFMKSDGVQVRRM
jgi:hypothetical protein